MATINYINSAGSTAALGIGNPDGSPFTHRAPKPKGLNVVKLTAGNMDSVAAEMRKIDGVEVNRWNEHISTMGVTYFAGDWIVQEWNYALEESRFRKATLEEREAHDLR